MTDGFPPKQVDKPFINDCGTCLKSTDTGATRSGWHYTQ